MWLPDNKRVAAAVGKAVRIWRVEDWKPEGELAVHEKGVLSLAVSPDGRFLASSGYGADVLVSDLNTDEVTMRSSAMAGVWALSFSPDGRFLLGGTETGGPRIWQVCADENRLESIRVGMERSETQCAAMLDPTGRTLVTVSEGDRQIRLWDAREIFGYSFVSFPEDCLAVAYEKDWAIPLHGMGTLSSANCRIARYSPNFVATRRQRRKPRYHRPVARLRRSPATGKCCCGISTHLSCAAA